MADIENTPTPSSSLSINSLRAFPEYEKLPPGEKLLFATKLIPQLSEMPEPDLQRVLGIEPETLEVGGMPWANRMGVANTPAGIIVNAIEGTVKDPAALGATVGEIGGYATGVPGLGQAGAFVGGTGGAMIGGKPLGEAALEGTKQLGLSVGGTGASAIATNIGRGARLMTTGKGARAISAEAEVAERFLAPGFTRSGFRHTPLTAAELTESPMMDVAQNIAEVGLGGAGRMREFYKGRTLAVNDLVDDFLQGITPDTDPEVIAQVFRQGLEAKNADSLMASNLARTEFRKAARNISLTYDEMQGLRRIAEPFSERAERTGGIAAERSGATLANRVLAMVERMKPQTRVAERQIDTGAVDAAGNPIMQLAHDLEAVPVTPVNVEDLDKLQQLLSDSMRGLQQGERVPKEQRFLIKKLDREINRLIQAKTSDVPLDAVPGGEHAGLSVYNLFRSSDELVKARVTSTDSPFLRKLIRISDPELLARQGGGGGGDKLVDTVFATPNTIAATQRAVGRDSTEWKMLQRRYAQKLLSTVTNAKGEINGGKLLDNLVGKRGEYEDVFRAAFPDPTQREWLIKFSHSLKTYQEKGLQAGLVATELGQGGAIFSAAQAAGQGELGKVGKILAVTVIPPYLFSRMLTNPRAARLLTMSMRTPATAKEAASIVARLAAESEAIKNQEDFEAFQNAKKSGVLVPFGQGQVRLNVPNTPLPAGMKPKSPVPILER